MSRKHRSLRQSGFTLVEVLTVLVIVGLVSSAVVLTLPRDKPVIEQFSKQFLRDTNAMAQDSLLSGVPNALGLSEDRYAVMRYTEGEWNSLLETDIPDGAVIRFAKDEISISLSDKLQPLVIFEPTGQSSMFRLQVSTPEGSVEFISEGDGRVFAETGL